MNVCVKPFVHQWRLRWSDCLQPYQKTHVGYGQLYRKGLRPVLPLKVKQETSKYIQLGPSLRCYGCTGRPRSVWTGSFALECTIYCSKKGNLQMKSVQMMMTKAMLPLLQTGSWLTVFTWQRLSLMKCLLEQLQLAG